VSFQQIIENKSPEILSTAVLVLESARLKSYASEMTDTIWVRMRLLLEVAERCLRDRDGRPMIGYAEDLARKRYKAGCALHEIQTVFNSLEEALWEQMMSDVEPTEFLAAMGMVSSVIGMGKDAVARTYVELSTDLVQLAGQSWEISKNPEKHSVLSRSKPDDISPAGGPCK
jgi:hypothetical protein